LLQEAVRRASQEPRVQLQIKTQRPELDGLVEGIVCTPWRLSYILLLPHLSSGPYRVPKTRERARIGWAVRKASKLGVTLRPALTDADLGKWYGTYLETMRHNMVPPRSYRFFATIWRTLQPAGMMQVLLAEHGEGSKKKIIAGSIFLIFGQTVSYAFNGMRRQYASFRANDAIMWYAIRAACEKGFQWFDFGEVPDDDTELAKFKSKWGAQPTRLYRYMSPAPPKLEGQPGNLHRYGSVLAQKIWTKLPLKATAWIGDQIYSFL
jgi:hypothetical protein